MNFPVFDLHCDTASELIGEDYQGGVPLRKNSAHFDLERAKQLPGYAQCFACFTTNFKKGNPTAIFELQMAALLSEMEKNPDLVRQAYTAADVRKNYEDGIISGILTIEGPAGFGYDPALLKDLYNVGFRISSLGWNENNVLTGSNVTGGGLTDLGREYVREAQSVGMIVDVSHISDEGFWDIMDITTKPIVATHSNSRAVCDHTRNLTDDMFRAICQTGGVAGLNMYTDFLGQKPNLDTVCNHVLHWLELNPDGNHISLGSDMDGCDVLPEGFAGVQSYPALALRLLERGVDEKTVHKIYWDNALGVMEACCM